MTRILALVSIVAGLLVGACASQPPQLPVEAMGHVERHFPGTPVGPFHAVAYELAEGVEPIAKTAAAYKFAHPSFPEAQRAAKAFGVRQAARVAPHGWHFGQPTGPTMYLEISPSGSFTSKPNPANPVTPRPDFDSRAARRAALGVLRVAGIDIPQRVVTVPEADHVFDVRISGRIDNQPVDGVATDVIFDTAGQLHFLAGTLTSPRVVGHYELASLRTALDRLNAGLAFGGARDLMAAIPPTATGRVPVRLTAVRLELVQVTDGDTRWLVPAYVFTTDQQHATVAVSALADRYFAKTRSAA